MNTEIVYAKPQPSKKLRSKLIALAVAIPTLFLLCAIGFYFKRPLTPTGLQGFTLKQLFSGFTVETWALDRMNQMLEVWNDFDKLTPDEASKYNGLNLLALFPETYQCDRNYFQKIGGLWSCGEFFRPLPSGCTSVSLGSNSGFVSNFGCTIYTFDCKRNPSESLNTRIYPWCFDEAGQLDKIHKTWHNAMDELGIVQVDYLKIDLNGDEWTTLPILINEWNIQSSPKQMFLQMNVCSQSETVSSSLKAVKTTSGWDFLHPTIHLFRSLQTFGYRIATAEMNDNCHIHFTLVLAK